MDKFNTLLNSFIKAKHIDKREVAARLEIHPSMLSRALHKKSGFVKPNLILSLAIMLDLNVAETEELFMAAGYNMTPDGISYFTDFVYPLIEETYLKTTAQKNAAIYRFAPLPFGDGLYTIHKP